MRARGLRHAGCLPNSAIIIIMPRTFAAPASARREAPPTIVTMMCEAPGRALPPLATP